MSQTCIRLLLAVLITLFVPATLVSAAQYLGEPFVWSYSKTQPFIFMPGGQAATKDNAVCGMSWIKSKTLRKLGKRVVVDAKVEVEPKSGQWKIFTSSTRMDAIEARCWLILQAKGSGKHPDRLVYPTGPDSAVIHARTPYNKPAFRGGSHIHPERYGDAFLWRIVKDNKAFVHCVPQSQPVVRYVGPLAQGTLNNLAADAANKMAREGRVHYNGHTIDGGTLNLFFNVVVGGIRQHQNDLLVASFDYRCFVQKHR